MLLKLQVISLRVANVPTVKSLIFLHSSNFERVHKFLTTCFNGKIKLTSIHIYFKTTLKLFEIIIN